jgi:hypothetical protein
MTEVDDAVLLWFRTLADDNILQSEGKLLSNYTSGTKIYVYVPWVSL